MQTAKLDTNAASALIRGRATAQACAELRTSMERRGVSLASMDLLIAAHALAENCTLVNGDGAFARVPGLETFDPATAP